MPPKGSDFTEDEKWVRKLWRRIDRTKSGTISTEELNCEEFRTVVQESLTPKGVDHVRGSYSRPEINIDQALGFLLRKADGDKDGRLTLEEFSSFVQALRKPQGAKHIAKLVFAFFDLDGSRTLDREELGGIYRFYTGHSATAEVLREIWSKLDPDSTGSATQEQYVRWLETSAPQVFRQGLAPAESAEDHSTGLVDDSDSFAEADACARRFLRRLRHAPQPAMLPAMRKLKMEDHRPVWNQRLNPVDMNVINPLLPKSRKNYFSRCQTMPELQLHYVKHRGFDKHARRLRAPEEPSAPLILSTASRAMPEIIPEGSNAAGTMTNCKGNTVLWSDSWQTPGPMRPTRREPGTLQLKCPGAPPEWIVFGKDLEKVLRARMKTA